MIDRRPFWARWKASRLEARPFALVILRGAEGVRTRAHITGIGRGWVSVLVRRQESIRCEVWPPSCVAWDHAELFELCRGVEIETEEATHRAEVDDVGEARIWRWIARAVEVGATVEPLW